MIVSTDTFTNNDCGLEHRNKRGIREGVGLGRAGKKLGERADDSPTSSSVLPLVSGNKKNAIIPFETLVTA